MLCTIIRRVSCVCGWYGVDWGDRLVFNEHQAEIIIAEQEKNNEDTADA
jgi:hypothetical protein